MQIQYDIRFFGRNDRIDGSLLYIGKAITNYHALLKQFNILLWHFESLEELVNFLQSLSGFEICPMTKDRTSVVFNGFDI